jgi:outer membrane protein W
MRRRATVRFLTAALVSTLLPLSAALAEDTRGKWQFGLGMSYFSTADYIRSNSDLAFAGHTIDQNGLPGVGSTDPRPDGNMRNQASIADDFKIDFSGSYGMTRWLALEIMASYQQSHVGNIEYWTSNSSPAYNGSPSVNTSLSSCGPTGNQSCWNYPTSATEPVVTNSFLPVGQIREIPIHLSGLVRFRPESPLDPYIGLGVGYIYANMKTGTEFNQVAADVSKLRVNAASEGEYTDPARTDKSAAAPGFQPGPLQATVRNSFEWHAISGVDYYVNDHFSFYIDARYAWTSGQVDIRTDDAHQVQFAMLDEGKLVLQQQLFDPAQGPSSGAYLWEDVGLRNPNTGSAIPAGECQNVNGDHGCDNLVRWGQGDRFLETEDKNLNGLLDQNEDDGVIHVFPPGPRDPGEFLDDKTFICVPCIGNESSITPPPSRPMPDTEDLNFNGFMDRYLYYGVDICTTSQGANNPICSGVPPQATPNYVWPGAGCLNTAPIDKTAARQVSTSGSVTYLNNEGCPTPPASAGTSLTKTDSDNVSDVVIIQGGRIRLGGFGLGFGFKFTF